MPRARRARRRLGPDAALVVGAAALAWLAQATLRERPGSSDDGSVVYLIAVACFVGAAIRLEGGLAVPPAASRAWGHLRRVVVGTEERRASMIAAAVGLAVVLLIMLRGKGPATTYWDAFALWIVSAALAIAAFLPKRWYERLVHAVHQRERWRVLATVIRLTAVAALFRFIWLGAHPNVISGDEGRIAGLALATTRGELPNLFSTTYGHSVLYLYLMALPYHVAGVNPVTFRLLHAVAGSLTVGLTYLLGRRMFDARAGAIAAVLLAVSHMHLHFSRLAVAGGIMDALLTTLAVYLFYGGLSARRAWELTLSGAVVGFHLYVYMGGRLTALFLLPAIVLLAIFNRSLVRENAVGIAGFVLALCVVGAPFAQWSLTHPEQFMDRANQVGIYPTGWLANEVRTNGVTELQVLLRQLWNALLAFNQHAATNFYNAEIPMLDFVTSIPAVLGLAYALLRVHEARFLLLNGWFWASVLVGQVLLVTPERNAYRILIVLPVTMLLAAVGWSKLLDFAKRAIVPSRSIGVLLTVAFLGLASYGNLHYYFVRFLPTCRLEDANTRRASILGRYLGTLDRSVKAYVYGPPHYVYGVHPSVDFLSRGLPAVNVEPAQASGLTFLDATRRPVFIYVPQRRAESRIAEEAYPVGRWRDLVDCGTPVLHAYEA